MPPQVIPPGHLEWHAALVAVSPAILAAVGTWCAARFGAGPRARIGALLLVLLALVLEASFLKVGGLAAASSFPLGRGWVRLGTAQVAASLLAGVWIAVRQRPGPGRAASLGAWGAWIGCALVMPMTVCPAVAIAPVVGPQGQPEGRPWRRPLALTVLLLTTALAVWLRQADVVDPWGPRLAALAGLLVAIVGTPRGWWPVLVVAAVAQLLPLPHDPM